MSEITALSNHQHVFVQELRQLTAESHQRLEANDLSVALMRPDVSLADYGSYLIKMYGLMQACEQDVFPFLKDLVPQMPERKKADLILQDLSAIHAHEGAAATLPVFQFNCCNVAEAFGIMYVLEGSTLGGRVLYKHVYQHLGLTPENGASFFWGYGQQTGTMWKSFISSLTQFATESGDTSTITNSAIKTFEATDNWLSDRN